MPRELQPEDILKALEKGLLAPFYLFYGPDEFRREKILDRIREVFIPESFRDFNVEIFYGAKKTDTQIIINSARSIPLMARNRLIIVRRTENFTADQLEKLLPYLEDPAEATCVTFTSSKADFKKKFYRKMKASGRTVNFRELTERQVVPWIKRTAGELGLKIDDASCQCLQQMAGNRLMDLYSELEKLYLRHGKTSVGVDQVRELAIHSRLYTIFELMNAVSAKNCARSLNVLNRYLEEENKREVPLRVIGMLNRQIRLLWQTKSILSGGGRIKEVSEKLGLPNFSARNFVDQSKHWSEEELERGLYFLYQADGLLKASARPKPILENLILSLCV